MKILILGMDGYLGWPLACHLASEGHDIGGLDRFYRRSWVTDMGSDSAIPISPMYDRVQAFKDHFDFLPDFREIDMLDYQRLAGFLEEFEPDAIVHLAECPSAPYSMSLPGRAVDVMQNNVIGTLNLLHAIRDKAPEAHLVKLGTMGEYGTPNVDIPEGFFQVNFRGREDLLTFPRKAGSWYHWSKVHDSMNVMFACETYGLRSTDIMQGVVYGTQIEAMGNDDRMRTRLDFDEAFGTVVNRFVCQALIGHPLTIYGDAGGQTRGFLPLKDSMQCLTLAIENPVEAGKYRVLNQFDQVYSVLTLAEAVHAIGNAGGLDVRVAHYEAPRSEAEEHYYSPDRQGLIDLGYQPSRDLHGVLREMFNDLAPYGERIGRYQEVLVPWVQWSGEARKSRVIGERITEAGADSDTALIG